MKLNPKKMLTGIFLLSVVGWINAAYTLWHRQKIVGGIAQGKSFCNFSSLFNCDAVALSKHSLFLNIPVSSWGMIFYTFMILVSLWGLFAQIDQKEDDVKKSLRTLFTLSAFSLIPTVYLAAVSYFLIGTICIMCSITYAINLILLILSWQAFKNFKSTPTIQSLKSIPNVYLGLGILLALVQLISHKIVNNMLSSTDDDLDEKTVAMFVSRHLSSPKQNFNTQNAPFYGPENAPVTLVEFSDFQCPFCAKSAATMPSMIADYKGKIKVVFKNFPIDPSCNNEVKSTGHPLACLAAKTGWCVFKLKGNDAFFKYKETTFENQEGLTASKIKDYGQASGIEATELDTCVNDYTTTQTIQEQVAEAKAADVQGTPAIYINGKVVEAGFVPKIFKAVMEKY